MGEAFLSVFLAMIISLIITSLLLPAFNRFIEREIRLDVISDISFVPVILLLFAVVGIASGIYPAFLLSSFKPVNAIKNNQLIRTSKNPLILRNALVLLQFSITIILIIFSMVIYKQLEFINMSAGFNKKNIVEVRLRDNKLLGKIEAIKHDLLANTNILGVTFSSSTPVDIGNVSNAQIEDEEKGEMVTLPQVNSNYIDYDFFDVYDLKIIKGRNFSRDFTTDEVNAVILNETALRQAGLKNPLGKKFSRWDIKNGRIIGIVKDFHFTSFRKNIEPVVFQLKPVRALRTSIKLKSANIKESLDFIESTFLRHNSDFIFNYQFIDDSFNRLYKTEQRLGDLVVIFSIVAIIIASLGLVGLISYITEQSTREVGIRKTLGASVTNIIILLSKDFMVLVAISNIIAWPISYLIINQWLHEFAYRTNISPGIFFLAGIFTLLFAILTVSSYTLKAAHANPIDSLRYE
jgi:putative ABC transport system permease protein